MAKKFYIFSAGCIRRGLDTIRIQNYLKANGWRLTNRIGRADLIVISTCGVVRLNEIASLNGIAKAARKKAPSATLVVSGCLPKINPEEINRIGDFTSIPTGEFEKFDRLIQAEVPFESIKPPDSISDNPAITDYLVARSFCRKSRAYKWLFYKFNMSAAFLKISVFLGRALSWITGLFRGRGGRKIVPYYNIEISRGCLSNCRFCATKMAIGNVRSRPQEEILEELRKGLKKGYRHFQLIADDTGCYGQDIGTSLAGLLRQMFEVEGNFQLIIIDCHPRWLIALYDELIPLLVKHQDKVKELFVPLQSGSDRMLEKMARDHTATRIKPILQELNERAPGIAIRAGLLIGFPGETEEDFEETKRFISEVKFAEVAVNRYEDRPNTQSSGMNGKVEQEVIESRAKYLAEHLNCRILS